MGPNQLLLKLADHSFELLNFRRIFFTVVGFLQNLDDLIDGFSKLLLVLDLPNDAERADHAVAKPSGACSPVFGGYIGEEVVDILVCFEAIAHVKEVFVIGHLDLPIFQ